MTEVNRGPAPGTQAFRSALVQALNQAGGGLERHGARLDEGEWVSRNTVIYRGTLGSLPVVAKAQSTKPASVVAAEYRMLRDMERVLNTEGVRSLRPVAVLEELGALVTIEEPGVSLRRIIESELPGPDLSRSVRGVAAAARALRAFHDAYIEASRVTEPKQERGTVRWYLDFGPKNLLIQEESGHGQKPTVILMDPPEEGRWGDRWRDVGGFCFDVARIRFLPGFVFRMSVSLALDHLKAVFIRTYCHSVGEPVGRALPPIFEGERRRAAQALHWYLHPWRFHSPVKEALRLAYLGPLTAEYRRWGVRRSYRVVAGLLERDDPWWDRFQREPVIR